MKRIALISDHASPRATLGGVDCGGQNECATGGAGARCEWLLSGNANKFSAERLFSEQRAVDEADAIIAESPQGRDDLMSHYAAPRNRLRLIPCGVDSERFRPVPRHRARAALGIPNDDFVALQLIGSVVGGIKYTVLNEETGLLVPPRDPGEIAGALRRIFEAPEWRVMLGSRGHQRALNAFSWFDVVRAMIQIYDDVTVGAQGNRRTTGDTPHDHAVADRATFDRRTSKDGSDSLNDTSEQTRK
ncbi:MAG: glycosyltransferase [Gemmatimonadaceae bacterium]